MLLTRFLLLSFPPSTVRVQQPDSEAFKTFTFDSVYPPGTEQKFIFDDCTKPIIDSVLNGYNGTLFCYGQTGTGKCWGKDTPMLLYDGRTKFVQDIEAGDQVSHRMPRGIQSIRSTDGG
jgi:hypothetical protein